MNFDFKGAFDAVIKYLCTLRDKACEAIPLLESILQQGSSHDTPQYNQICNFDELAALLQDPNQNDDVFAACLVGDANAPPIFVQYIRDEDTGVITYTNLSTNLPIEATEFKPCPDVKWSTQCYQDADGNYAGTLYTCLKEGAVTANTFVPVSGVAVDGLPDDLSQCEMPLEAVCYESQEYTYGLDNTGTNYLWDDATYEIKLSDGSTIEFKQTPAANGGWTPQMQEWGANIQQAADDAGLLWKVETRYIAAAGSLVGGGGFAGPPSVPVSEGLYAGGMRWRYVNIQICPGQPTPVSASIVTVADPAGVATRPDGYALTTAGAILGPIVEYQRCEKCGDSPTWFVRDKFTNIVRPATAGEIPLCAQPCGTLALVAPPAERECNHVFDSGCDNINEPNDDTNWVNLVTRRITYCAGEQVAQDFFVPDPADPNSLIGYTLVGAYVDCASGTPIGDPAPPCEDCVPLGNLWIPSVPTGSEGWKVNYWQPTANGGNAAPHGNVSDIFTISGDSLVHVNGAPSHTAIMNTANIATSAGSFLTAMGFNATTDTSGQGQLTAEGYYHFKKATTITDSNTNTGERGALYLQQCCRGALELVFERTTDTVNGDVGIFTDIPVPAGTHKVAMAASDLSSWMGLILSAGGEPIIPSSKKPIIDCIPVVKCKDSNTLAHAVTGELVVETEETSWHKVDCVPEFISPDC